MPVLLREHESRFPLGAGATLSALVHIGLVVVMFFFVSTIVLKPPPAPKNLVLTLVAAPPEPPPPLKPPPLPPPRIKPPPKLLPTPQIKTPQAIVSRTLSAHAVATAPPPPPPKLAPAKPAPPPPPHPEAGVVGHHVSEDFRNKLEDAIHKNLRYPPMAARQGRQGSAVVRVRMKRDGTVISITLLDSSGTQSLDKEAQDVFRRIGTLPKMPPDFLPRASEFQFSLSINFHLRGIGY